MPDFDHLNPPKRVTDPIHHDPKHPQYAGPWAKSDPDPEPDPEPEPDRAPVRRGRPPTKEMTHD